MKLKRDLCHCNLHEGALIARVIVLLGGKTVKNKSRQKFFGSMAATVVKNKLPVYNSHDLAAFVYLHKHYETDDDDYPHKYGFVIQN